MIFAVDSDWVGQKITIFYGRNRMTFGPRVTIFYDHCRRHYLLRPFLYLTCQPPQTLRGYNFPHIGPFFSKQARIDSPDHELSIRTGSV